MAEPLSTVIATVAKEALAVAKETAKEVAELVKSSKESVLNREKLITLESGETESGHRELKLSVNKAIFADGLLKISEKFIQNLMELKEKLDAGEITKKKFDGTLGEVVKKMELTDRVSSLQDQVRYGDGKFTADFRGNYLMGEEYVTIRRDADGTLVANKTILSKDKPFIMEVKNWKAESFESAARRFESSGGKKEHVFGQLREMIEEANKTGERVMLSVPLDSGLDPKFISTFEIAFKMGVEVVAHAPLKLQHNTI